MAVGSGGDVGGANFNIHGESDGSVEKALENIAKAAKLAGNEVNKALGGLPKAASAKIFDEKSAKEAKKSLDEVKGSLKGVLTEEEKVKKADAFKAHQASRRAAVKDNENIVTSLGKVARANENAGKRERELIAIREKARKDQLAGTGKFLVVNPATGAEEKKTLTEIAKRLQAINTEAKVLRVQLGETIAAPSLEKLRTEAVNLHTAVGSSFKGFVGDTTNATKATSFFGRVVEGLNGRLARMGLDVRSVSVLLGAGLAGGIAGVIKIAVDLGSKLAAFVGRLQDVQRETKLTFGAGAADVEDFAERSADALGRTEEEMLNLINTFARGIRALNLPETALAPLSSLLAEVTSRLERALPGFEDLADVQKTVQSALGGSEEALRQLGVTADEQSRLAFELFGKTEAITPVEKAILGVVAATRESEDATAIAGRIQASSWEKVKNTVNEVGEALGDILTQDQQERFNSAASAIREIGSGLDTVNISADVFEENLATLGDKQLEQLLALAKIRKPTNEAEAIAQEIYIAQIEKEIALRKELINQQNEQLKTSLALVDVAKENEKAFLRSTSAQRGAIDAIKALERAEADGARSIREALVDRERAYEDAAKRERDVRLDNQRSIEDANKDVRDAEIDLQRAREDRTEKVSDFLREQNRKRKDINREHLRNLEDFNKEEKKLRKDNADAIFDATLAIGQALRKGDIDAERAARLALTRAREKANESIEDQRIDRERELQDFRREAAREEEDRIEGLDDLERESNRQLFDAQKKLEEAFRDRQRAFEDAVNALNDLEVENNRALKDAQKAVDDATREAEEAIADANIQLERMASDLRIILSRLREIVALLNQGVSPQGLINPLTGLPLIPSSTNAAGGTIAFGQVGLTGEKGRELVIGGSAGSTILPNDITERLLALLSGKAAGPAPNITINEVANDPEATAFAVWARTLRNVNN